MTYLLILLTVWLAPVAIGVFCYGWNMLLKGEHEYWWAWIVWPFSAVGLFIFGLWSLGKAIVDYVLKRKAST